ncbi:hypothetical protein [Pseudomonas sp.]|uniref:hypothetical protein n=1 Tax=Pseudomonas sp. TaxID=306 RepID=UPI003D1030F1
MKALDSLGRKCVLISLGLVLALVLLGTVLWINFTSSSELDGRYSASGQMQLSSGEVIDVSHTVQVRDGRFYAMTRQGNAVLETAGVVEYGFLGRYRLRVESGEVTGLAGDTDNDLVFNMMYGRHKGSTIHLVPFRSCLYGQETRQVYCIAKQQSPL